MAIRDRVGFEPAKPKGPKASFKTQVPARRVCSRLSARPLRNLWKSIDWNAVGGMIVKLEAAIDLMVHACSANAVWTAASKYFGNQGFDRLIYADMTTNLPVVRNTFPASFDEYYLDVCNPEADPFFRHCCATLAPIGTGWDYARDYDYLGPSDLAIIETAHEAGMRAGFSCTFHPAGPAGVGGWNIGSTLARRDVEALRRENGTVFRLAALYAHERMASLRGRDDAPDVALSPREHDCLAYLATGMKTQQIADQLGIKPVTVELHLRRARVRLGAKTREQALAIALHRHWLRL